MHGYSEERIRQLCERLVELDGQAEEFNQTAKELREALRQHFNRTRDRVADLAFVTAAYEHRSLAA